MLQSTLSPIKCVSCGETIGIEYKNGQHTSKISVYCYYCALSIAFFTDFLNSKHSPTVHETEQVFFEGPNALNRVSWNLTMRHLNAHGYENPEEDRVSSQDKDDRVLADECKA